MSREKIIEAIHKASLDNRLSCEKAHDLARELSVSVKEIGGLCNELKIRITACRLGCF